MNQPNKKRSSVTRVVIYIFLTVSGVTGAAYFMVQAALPRLLSPAKPVVLTPPEEVIAGARDVVCSVASKHIFEGLEPFDPEYPTLLACGNYFLLSRGATHFGKRYIFDYSGEIVGWFEMTGAHRGECDGLGCNFSQPCSSADVCRGIELTCTNDQCQYINARRLNDASKCMNIQKQEWLMDCLSNLAMENNNEKLCAGMPDPRRQYMCYKEVGYNIGAFYAKNIEECSRLFPMAVQPCKQRYEYHHNNRSIMLSDWHYCLETENKELQNVCLTDMASTVGDESICAKVNDSPFFRYTQEYCYYATGWMIASQAKSQEECTALRNEYAREKCIEHYKVLHGN